MSNVEKNITVSDGSALYELPENYSDEVRLTSWVFEEGAVDQCPVK